jgi:hypothetical protein
MSHSFEVGKTYRNRVGEYVVQALDGDKMTIRYVGGATLVTNVHIQTRIWENIQFEEQMARQEERQRQAREARMASRRRTARAKKAVAIPTFGGFQKSDFDPKRRGIAWSSRKELGRVLVHELSQRTKEAFDFWIVPRQSEVHVARKEHYDRDARDRNAALYVAVSDKGAAYGLRVGKPGGKAKARWPWSAFVTALNESNQVRRSLRAAMKTHELSLDFYAMEESYGQVGQITVQTRGFLWQHETAEQETTRRMDWAKLTEYLHTAAADKRCDLYLRCHVSSENALKAGADIVGEIALVFEALMPVYEASVGA